MIKLLSIVIGIHIKIDFDNILFTIIHCNRKQYIIMEKEDFLKTLTEDQVEIFEAFERGENIFMTGPGGCGKSYMIKHMMQYSKDAKHTQVCAMTGCAAVLLECGASTLHSWAGIGLCKNTEDHIIITRISMNKYKRKKWKQANILIIDEVSMMSKRLFELLDQIGKKIRNISKPFGGIQVIFSGDFYQLPPKIGRAHV